MKPEQQRIAIAEWCGWKLMDVADGTKFSNPEEPLIVQRWVNKDLGLLSRKLPDYLNDLNAIHEAEKFMEENRPTLCFKYSNNLRMVINPGGPVGDFRLIHATAEQRAEALLKTIGTRLHPPHERLM